jgi:hypothetical protein
VDCGKRSVGFVMCYLLQWRDSGGGDSCGVIVVVACVAVSLVTVAVTAVVVAVVVFARGGICDSGGGSGGRCWSGRDDL